MCFPWRVLGGRNLQGVTAGLFDCFSSYACCQVFSAVCLALDANASIPPMGSVIATPCKIYTAESFCGCFVNRQLV